MTTRDIIVDFSKFDLNHVLADIDEIRRINPQRYEMEQLTAVVYEDPERHIVVGYKDYSADDFWTRGHMPGMPVLPGVLMCEAAAQLCSYCCQKYDLLGAKVMGFGGLDEVRFRDPVLPGDRLVLMAEKLKARRGAMIVCRFQGYVRESLCVEGQIKGVPLPENLMAQGKPGA